mmetsp:Transcript_127299/g.247995  ORF Transcript_127299/g.247995 Transcript_127299/m.247995 type:complete len:80 (+) Transcript_127299:742-981(+)
MQGLLSARVPLGTHTRVPKLANMPKRRRAAKIGPFVTTATSVTGNATRVDVQHAELQQGQSGKADEPTVTVDCSTGWHS